MSDGNGPVPDATTVFQGDAAAIEVSRDGPRELRSATLFYHYPCFDGLVSAALAWDYLENHAGWQIEYRRPVNYDVGRTWTSLPLPERSAVVDFLYHPAAKFWADHHATTFLAGASPDPSAEGRQLLYDSSSASCAMLLWRRLGGELSDPTRYEEMALWGDRVDGARYDSVDDALFGCEPAYAINLSLLHEADAAYGERLLTQLRTKSLTDVAGDEQVRARVDYVRERTATGLELVRSASVLRPGNIAVFDVASAPEAIVNRYSAFAVYGDARYSVGLLRDGSGAKITAMRNPWREFESVHLGRIFKPYGGGGHQRVASVIIGSAAGRDADEVLDRIVHDIRAADESALAVSH